MSSFPSDRQLCLVARDVTASSHPKRLVRYAEGLGRSLARTANHTKPWPTFIAEFKKPMRSGERMKDYLRYPKAQQDKLKLAAGWIIGAPMAGGRRNRASVLPRDIITFDCDAMPAELLAEITAGTHPFCRYEWFLHTTRKHTSEAPRVRFMVLAASAIDPDAYDAVARVLAHQIDPTMDAVDDVSFRATQLMFKPSCSKDADFIFHHNPGVAVDTDAMLDVWSTENGDWRDFRNLPFSERQGQRRASAKKAENPLEKPGVIGAFCRAYTVQEAIEEFLTDAYAPGDHAGGKPRYTYQGGSTSNGVVVEDDGLFIYSHHSTDPCSGRLCNAWDMVRQHLFGGKDADAEPDTAPGKLPSFKAMTALAIEDARVKREMMAEHMRSIEEFEDIIPASL